MDFVIAHAVALLALALCAGVAAGAPRGQAAREQQRHGKRAEHGGGRLVRMGLLTAGFHNRGYVQPCGSS